MSEEKGQSFKSGKPGKESAATKNMFGQSKNKMSLNVGSDEGTDGPGSQSGSPQALGLSQSLNKKPGLTDSSKNKAPIFTQQLIQPAIQTRPGSKHGASL